MGGEIGVRSQPGYGSTFWFTARFGQREEVERARPRVPASARSERPRILVVEDNAVNQKVAVAMLENLGYQPEVAGNGLEAVEACSRIAYDAVFMDCQMPEMDGYEAARAIRELEAARVATAARIPIIALTANAMKESEQKVMEAGCSGFQTKPINIDQLLQTLAELLGGKRVEEPPHMQTPAASTVRPPVAAQPAGDPIRSRLAGVAKLRPAVRKFTQRLGEQTAALARAQVVGNFTELASLAHWLKGAAGTVGYDVFTEPATRLEQEAKAGSARGIDAALAEIRSLAQRLEIPEEIPTTGVQA
jgi:CheY-like chemotaxis protein/HPt (histidine-containing phosphotransfer) domain-containing protein